MTMGRDNLERWVHICQIFETWTNTWSWNSAWRSDGIWYTAQNYTNVVYSLRVTSAGTSDNPWTDLPESHEYTFVTSTLRNFMTELCSSPIIVLLFQHSANANWLNLQALATNRRRQVAGWRTRKREYCLAVCRPRAQQAGIQSWEAATEKSICASDKCGG